MGYRLWTRTGAKEFRHNKKDRDIQNNQKLTGGMEEETKLGKSYSRKGTK